MLMPRPPRLLCRLLPALFLMVMAACSRGPESEPSSSGPAPSAEAPAEAAPSLEVGDPEDPWVAARGPLRLRASELQHIVAWRHALEPELSEPRETERIAEEAIEEHARQGLRWKKLLAIAEEEGWTVTDEELTDARVAVTQIDLRDLDEAAILTLLRSRWPEHAMHAFEDRLRERVVWERFARERGEAPSPEELEAEWRRQRTAIRTEVFRIINDPPIERIREIIEFEEPRMRVHYERNRETLYTFPPDIERLVFLFTPEPEGSLAIAERAASTLLEALQREGFEDGLASLRSRYEGRVSVRAPWDDTPPELALENASLHLQPMGDEVQAIIAVELRPATVLEYDRRLQRRIAEELARAEGLAPQTQEIATALIEALRAGDNAAVQRLVEERGVVRQEIPFFTQRASHFVPGVGEDEALSRVLFDPALEVGSVLDEPWAGTDAAWVIRLVERVDADMDRFRRQLGALQEARAYADGARQWVESVEAWESEHPLQVEHERFREVLQRRPAPPRPSTESP